MEAEFIYPPPVGHPAGASLCNWLGAAHSRILGTTKLKPGLKSRSPSELKCSQPSSEALLCCRNQDSAWAPRGLFKSSHVVSHSVKMGNVCHPVTHDTREPLPMVLESWEIPLASGYPSFYKTRDDKKLLSTSLSEGCRLIKPKLQ